MPDQWLILLGVGLFAGLFSGMFGIGGGVVIVPALIIITGMETIQATSTSLAAIMLPVGLFAVIAYWRAGLLELRSASLIALGLVITSYVGAEIAISLPEDTLRRIYGLFLLYTGWRFMEPYKVAAELRAGTFSLKAPSASNNSGTNPAPVKEEIKPPDVPWYVIFAVGLVAGIASGMFGIGGGAIIVPALVAILHYDQKLAVGTSLGALLLPVGLPGVIRYYDEGVLDIPVAAIVAVGLMIGAIFGAQIALGLPSRTVKRMYGVFLIVIALRFILRGLI